MRLFIILYWATIDSLKMGILIKLYLSMAHSLTEHCSWLARGVHGGANKAEIGVIESHIATIASNALSLTRLMMGGDDDDDVNILFRPTLKAPTDFAIQRSVNEMLCLHTYQHSHASFPPLSCLLTHIDTARKHFRVSLVAVYVVDDDVVCYYCCCLYTCSN